MDGQTTLLLFLVWTLALILCVRIGAEKNRTTEGVLCGLCLGIIGVLVMLLLEKRTYLGRAESPEWKARVERLEQERDPQLVEMRLDSLKRMLDRGQINEAEYQRKREDVLKDA